MLRNVLAESGKACASQVCVVLAKAFDMDMSHAVAGTRSWLKLLVLRRKVARLHRLVAVADALEEGLTLLAGLSQS